MAILQNAPQHSLLITPEGDVGPAFEGNRDVRRAEPFEPSCDKRAKLRIFVETHGRDADGVDRDRLLLDIEGTLDRIA